MTTNINKIVRSNLTLKPWILSKNTNEIVSTCIEKIYKQVPNSFRNDLLQTKMAAPRTENKGPIRAFRSQETKERTRQSNVSQSTRAKYRTPLSTGEQLLTAVMKTSKKGSAHNFAATKKLLKSPNYKIYGSRRFGSSASSSSASIFHRYDKQRRNRSQQTAQLNYLLRSFGSLGTSSKSFGLNPTVAKFLVPERNQHMQNPLGSLPQAMEVSSSIQRDLMAIDNTLKDRISLAKTRIAKLAGPDDGTKDTINPNEPKDALRGWHHPNAAELFLSRLNEGGVATAHLQEQHRKLQQSTRPNENKVQNFVFNGVGKKRSRVSDNLNAILRDITPRTSGHSHVVTKLETALERLPTRRFSSRKPLPSATEASPLEEPAAAPNTTTATATSMLVAEVDASASISSRNGRYNRSNHFNRRY